MKARREIMNTILIRVVRGTCLTSGDRNSMNNRTTILVIMLSSCLCLLESRPTMARLTTV